MTPQRKGSPQKHLRRSISLSRCNLQGALATLGLLAMTSIAFLIVLTLKPSGLSVRIFPRMLKAVCVCLKGQSFSFAAIGTAFCLAVRGQQGLKILKGSLLSGPNGHLADLQFRADSLLPMAIHEQAAKFQDVPEILKCKSPVCSRAELSSC